MATETTRRTLLQGCANTLLLLGATVRPMSLRAEEPYADPDAADRWLLPLLHAPGAVAGALHMGRFRDRIYYLDKAINWAPGSGQQGPSVTVPAGFVTDLASIPRVFWSILPPDDAYTYPAIIHDYMYWTQAYSREVADSVFRFGMDDMKVSSTVAWTIHAAVRAGGGSAWERNGRLKQSGEKRLLLEFPTDPVTTWAEWKKRPTCCTVL